MAESRGGRGRAARCGSKSLQPAAKPSPRGQTFHSFGQECPWNRSPGTLWFTRMPPPRAGGPRSTGLQCRGFGRVPNCTGISTAIESVLTQCISVWYNNATNQDCKALQRVVRLAERISGSTLPSLQGIYLKRCKSRAAKITKDSNHPGNHLFRLLPSGRRYRSLMAKTERLRKSFFPQAIRLLNTNSVP